MKEMGICYRVVQSGQQYHMLQKGQEETRIMKWLGIFSCDLVKAKLRWFEE